MKVNLEIDCTPEEARVFFGLPDVAPMQQRLIKDVEERMASSMKAMEPEAMIQNWLPASMQGLENLQKMFWTAVNKSTTSIPKKKVAP